MKLDISRENSDSLAFRVDGVEDVVNGTDQVPEECHYGFPVRNFNLIECYKKAEVNLACRIFLGGIRAQFDLVIGAVPYGPDRHYAGLRDGTERKDGRKDKSPAPDAQKRMFIGVVNFVESPEGVIPSSVWLESPKERPDFLRKLFGPTFHAVFERLSTARERECAFTGTRFGTSGDGDGVASIIEGSAEMVRSLNGEMLDDFRQRFVEPEFVNFLTRAIRIRLYDKGVWFGCEESTRFDFDIRNVLVCASDLLA
jgi:hypothetical protein